MSAKQTLLAAIVDQVSDRNISEQDTAAPFPNSRRTQTRSVVSGNFLHLLERGVQFVMNFICRKIHARPLRLLSRRNTASNKFLALANFIADGFLNEARYGFALVEDLFDRRLQFGIERNGKIRIMF